MTVKNDSAEAKEQIRVAGMFLTWLKEYFPMSLDALRAEDFSFDNMVAGYLEGHKRGVEEAKEVVK